ncbi:hypothetical protein PRIPAC_84019 [Pristionchus pacificus]|uniref:Uncharacterized protein n=1 Tax=Pristionchus pacificus TaxID=54126 RepID=A0A2A6BH24_PRIPA|nr:hypothetical protein PRIPAC_84019 [Pristionchus pacificus]|eukprot:PDM65136.1 hypothetical protein PRIPAC_53385 [Pristionchus pacificus]
MANIEDIAKQCAQKNKQVKKKKDYDDYELSLGSEKDDEKKKDGSKEQNSKGLEPKTKKSKKNTQSQDKEEEKKEGGGEEKKEEKEEEKEGDKISEKKVTVHFVPSVQTGVTPGTAAATTAPKKAAPPPQRRLLFDTVEETGEASSLPLSLPPLSISFPGSLAVHSLHTHTSD